MKKFPPRCGYEKRLCVRCVLGKQNTLWNNEPFVGNTDTVKLRVACSNHVLRRLKSKREGSIAKN